ncbi:Uncharacterized protein dnm_014170 [Desulfonema magnum]|uniref:Uncharacterized protein n=1 Tax=Desulfonema magnum TaxID=45655 RepID=A0A975GM29_9BACT|nr:Uncharacterized protein dnm_014170 [Desulfonema magnum]
MRCIIISIIPTEDYGDKQNSRSSSDMTLSDGLTVRNTDIHSCSFIRKFINTSRLFYGL